MAIVFLLVWFSCPAQTIIAGGDVGGTWARSQSPFLVTGELTIPSDSLLTVESGVEVFFIEYCGIIIQGRIMAVGTPSDSIRFTASDPEEGWESFRFTDHQWNGIDSSLLIYCDFSYGAPPSTFRYGGAIYVEHSMNIRISHCDFHHNNAFWGGAIYFDGSKARVEHCRLFENTARAYRGGAIAIESCIVDLVDCEIFSNDAYAGGGIWVNAIDGLFKDLDIHDNHARYYGGGIYCYYASPNYYLEFESCRITRNSARKCGGGIYFDPQNDQGVLFSSENRNSIFYNYSCLGSDLGYGSGPVIEIPLDTFTISLPDDYVTYPKAKFDIDPKVHLLGAPNSFDIWVSPSGNDANAGDTPVHPLKSVNAALRKVKCTPATPGKIHLFPGIYSPETTGDFFPIYMRSRITLSGTQQDLTILDAMQSGMSMILNEIQDAVVSHLTFTGGRRGISADEHYILSIHNCEPHFYHVAFRGNIDSTAWGVVYMENSSGNCCPVIESCEFSDNEIADCEIYINNHCSPDIINSIFRKCDPQVHPELWQMGTGIFCLNNCDPYMTNCRMEGYGAGLFYTGNFRITDCLFLNNETGLYAYNGYGIKAVNCSFIDNQQAIVNYGSLDLLNTLIYNYDSLENQIIYLDTRYGIPCTLNVDYSNIQGGPSSIVLGDAGCTITWGEGNIDADPLFQDPSTGHYIPGIDSPCLDAGRTDTAGLLLPEFDMALGWRVVYDRIDMGCYEVQWPVSLNEDERPPAVTVVYPNPSNDYLIIESENDGSFDWKIISMDGELRLSGNSVISGRKLKIDVSGIAPGTYLIEVRKNHKLTHKKIIVL